jgi:hypothetical protein
MTPTACQFLRHDVHPRWIGDLLVDRCSTCGCLWIPQTRPDAPVGADATTSPQPVGVGSLQVAATAGTAG